jgi:hypothetical protein
MVRRAIEASLHTIGMVGGLKTGDVAAHQGITPRHAQKVMKLAEANGWVKGIKAPHRHNAFYYRWIVFHSEATALQRDVGNEEIEISLALVSAYFWGKHA